MLSDKHYIISILTCAFVGISTGELNSAIMSSSWVFRGWFVHPFRAIPVSQPIINEEHLHVRSGTVQFKQQIYKFIHSTHLFRVSVSQ